MIPQPVFPESVHSSLSSPINTVLKTKLREHALILRNLATSLRANSNRSEDAIIQMLRAKKEVLLREVYTILSATLGVVPRPDEQFTWEYYDKEGKFGFDPVREPDEYSVVLQWIFFAVSARIVV